MREEIGACMGEIERDECIIIIIIMEVMIRMIKNNESLSKRVMIKGENGILGLMMEA